MGTVQAIRSFDDARVQIARGVTDGIETWTPTWSGSVGNPALVNGTMTGYFWRTPQWVEVCLQITMGSSTTFGTGVWSFTAPIAGAFSTPIAMGAAWCYDLSATRTYLAVAELLSTSAIYVNVDGTGGRVATTVPFTWASGDILNFSLRYPIKEL